MKNRWNTEKGVDGIHAVCTDMEQMENKVVCYYCGTIYDEERGKCPLCGSTERAAEEERPVRRERLTEQERKARRSGSRGKTAEKPKKEKTPTKGILIAAVVFLALAVLVVFYFIGDMIGWWPGLENRIERVEPSISIANTDCTELLLSPETLRFAGAGETKELTVSVNLSCNEKVYCHSEDPAVAEIAETAETAMGLELKSATFTVKAVAEGQTKIIVQCGDKTASCEVVCGAEAASQPDDPNAPTGGEDFVPQLNYDNEVSLGQKGESVTLRVTNLPDGAEVLWRSGNETIATVDADGILTAVGSGTTTVTVEVDGKTAEVKVNCSFSGSTGSGAHLQSGREDVSVRVGEKFDLYLYDSGGNHIDNITYTVEDPSVCKVENSYVTALARGTTKVTVTYQGQEFVCVVRVG